MGRFIYNLFFVAFVISSGISVATESNAYTDDDGVIHITIKGEEPPRKNPNQRAQPQAAAQASYLRGFYDDQVKNACNDAQGDLSRRDLNGIDQLIRQNEALEQNIELATGLASRDKLELKRSVLDCRRSLLVAKRGLHVEQYNYASEQARIYYEKARKGREMSEGMRKYLREIEK